MGPSLGIPELSPEGTHRPGPVGHDLKIDARLESLDDDGTSIVQPPPLNNLPKQSAQHRQHTNRKSRLTQFPASAHVPSSPSGIVTSNSRCSTGISASVFPGLYPWGQLFNAAPTTRFARVSTILTFALPRCGTRIDTRMGTTWPGVYVCTLAALSAYCSPLHRKRSHLAALKSVAVAESLVSCST